MSGKRAKRLRTAAELAQGPGKSNRAKKILLIAIPIALLAATAIIAYAVFFRENLAKPLTASITSPVKVIRKAQSLDELLKMNTDQLKDVDIAEMDLLCATGLKGSENLDVGKALARLNDWAERVRYWTEQSMLDFRQNPDKFKNSEARFRVLLLISVLQQDFGVHYNDRGERNCDFSNSKNPFIHGMIDDTNGGTCASMPVIYVAVGRRLGYPMKLVLAKTHIFARWENAETGERFNIEGTNKRFAEHPDSYYQNWPYPISDAEVKEGYYLKSLTPVEELAVFLQNRGNCLFDTERFIEAKTAFAVSYRLAPKNPVGQELIASAAAADRPAHARYVRGIPVREFLGEGATPSRQYPDPVQDVKRINAINRANMERMAGPLQPPQPYQPPALSGAQPYRPPQSGASQPPSPYSPANQNGPTNPYGYQPPYQAGRL